MAQIEILLPKMGESVAEATIIKWLVEEGQTVEADEPIVEIATDKVDSEVPAPEDGVIGKILVGEGDVIEVGIAIATFSTDGSVPDVSVKSDEKVEVEKVLKSQPTPVELDVLAPVSSALTEILIKNGPSGRFYSPLVRNIAKKEGIGMDELEAVSGTGKEGRVTKEDLLGYVAIRKNGSSELLVKSTPKPVPEVRKTRATPTVVSVNVGDEIVEMDRMRKLIAEHMVMSKHTSPHVTSFVEADVTNLVLWRNKIKDQFLKKEGEKLTFTPLFIEAVAKAIRDFPSINVQLDGDKIIYKKDINIGMAAALPTGNLIVPVIKRADQYNLVGLAKIVNDLANRARNNQLKPDEIQGGTYTVTNVGTFGNVMGTPIINQPQAGILALGAIRKKPAVIETPQGDALGIRQMMFLSHSYDHRIVDGMLGGTFVRRVADYLENFDLNREI